MWGHNVHGVALEELLKLLLGGRISEVPDVQTTALVSTGGGGIGSLGGRGGAVGVGGIVDGGRSQAVGDVVDGRHVDGVRHKVGRDGSLNGTVSNKQRGCLLCRGG